MTTAIVVVAACIAGLVGVAVWGTRMTASSGGAPRGFIEVFTFVSTGIVYVEPGPERTVVWRDSDGDSQIVGSGPWRNPLPQGVKAADLPWGEHRDIVGNPALDIVAWVLRFDRGRGDMVVVKASTGQILARTPVLAAADRSVVIASVDETAVYFATPDPTRGVAAVRQDDCWVWRWATGEAAEPAPDTGQYLNDLSAGVFGIYDALGLAFRDSDERTLSVADIPPSLERTDFGGAMSPDGRFWYPSGSSQIVDTATGGAVTIEASAERAYGWTGSAELTFTRPALVTCSATSGECRSTIGTPPFWFAGQGVCARFGLACGSSLPVN